MSAEGKGRGEAGRAPLRDRRCWRPGALVRGVGDGRKSALMSEVSGCDAHSKEKEAFKLEANLLKVRRKRGRDSRDLKGGRESSVGSTGKALKGPTRPRDLEVGSRYCRALGAGRIDCHCHVGTCEPPWSLLQSPTQSCARRKGACAAYASRKPATASQDPGLSWTVHRVH